MFECDEAPRVPDITASDNEISVFMVRSVDAHRDCRDQLADVRQTLDVDPNIEVVDVLVQEVKPRKKLWGIF